MVAAGAGCTSAMAGTEPERETQADGDDGLESKGTAVVFSPYVKVLNFM